MKTMATLAQMQPRRGTVPLQKATRPSFLRIFTAESSMLLYLCTSRLCIRVLMTSRGTFPNMLAALAKHPGHHEVNGLVIRVATFAPVLQGSWVSPNLAQEHVSVSQLEPSLGKLFGWNGYVSHSSERGISTDFGNWEKHTNGWIFKKMSFSFFSCNKSLNV